MKKRLAVPQCRGTASNVLTHAYVFFLDARCGNVHQQFSKKLKLQLDRLDKNLWSDISASRISLVIRYTESNQSASYLERQ